MCGNGTVAPALFFCGVYADANANAVGKRVAVSDTHPECLAKLVSHTPTV